MQTLLEIWLQLFLAVDTQRTTYLLLLTAGLSQNLLVLLFTLFLCIWNISGPLLDLNYLLSLWVRKNFLLYVTAVSCSTITPGLNPGIKLLEVSRLFPFYAKTR